MNLYHIVFKNLRHHKGKVILLVLGIIITVTAITALFSLTAAMNQKITGDFKEAGTTVLILPQTESKSFAFGGITIASEISYDTKELPNNIVDFLKEKKTSLNIKHIAPKKIYRGQIADQQVLIVGVDFKSELQVKNWLQIRGQVPVNENELILGNTVASVLKKHPDDLIVIDNNQYQISGVLSATGSLEDGIIMAPLPLAQKLSGNSSISLVELVIKNTPQFTKNVKALESLLQDTRVVPVKQVAESRKEVVKKYEYFTVLVSLTMTLIAGLIIATIMMNSVTERVKEIGIFRAIGFGKKQIITIFLLEAVSISALGGLLGYFLGLAVAKITVPYMGEEGLVIGWKPLWGLFMVFFSSILGLTASWLPAGKAADTDPAEALRYL